MRMAVDHDEEGPNPEDVTIDELKVQLAQELADADENGEDGAPASASKDTAVLPRRRGCPPKAAQPAAAATRRSIRARKSPDPAPALATSTRFMSMAEGMALRAGRLKMGQEKTKKQGSPVAKDDATPDAAVSLDARAPAQDVAEAVTEPEAAMAPEPEAEAEAEAEAESQPGPTADLEVAPQTTGTRRCAGR